MICLTLPRWTLLAAMGAAVVISCVVLITRSSTAELLHVGALTAQMDMREGLSVGGGDDANMPTRRGMFTEHAARKPLSGGVVQTNVLPEGDNLALMKSSRHSGESDAAWAKQMLSTGGSYAEEQEGTNLVTSGNSNTHPGLAQAHQRGVIEEQSAPASVREQEQSAPASEGEHSDEFVKAEDTQSKLALRDAELEDAADQGASKLLSSYSDAVNGAVDEYSKISQKVDARSARAFEGLPARAGAKSADFKEPAMAQGTHARQARQHPRRPIQHSRRARQMNKIEPDDPLADQKAVFNRLGVSGSLYGVPREYRDEVDATGGANAVMSKLPAYVRRAANEAADADYIRERAVPNRPKDAGPPKRYLDSVQKQAKAPLLKVAHGESLSQIINSAVKSALAKTPSPALSSFMQMESDDRAEDDAHPTGLTENKYYPAKGTSTLTQLPARRRRGRSASPARDDSPKNAAADPAATLNSIELPGVHEHTVQAQAFRSQVRHLDDQIDTIFGPSRAELRRRAASEHRAAAADKAQQLAHLSREQPMARTVVGGSGALPAAAAQQQLVSMQDAGVQAKERKEVAELREEVKKLKERSEVRKLKEQVDKLRQSVLDQEHKQVLAEGADDGDGVDEESIKDAFDRMDSDGDSTITVAQVNGALQDLDLYINRADLQGILASEGIEKRDAVDLQGFTNVVHRVEEVLEQEGKKPRVCEDKLHQLFDEHDADHQGELNKDELKEALTALLNADNFDDNFEMYYPRDEEDEGLFNLIGTARRETCTSNPSVTNPIFGGCLDKESPCVPDPDNDDWKSTCDDVKVSFEEFKDLALRNAFSKYTKMGLKNDGDTSRGNRVRDWITAKQLRSLARDLGVQISLKKAKWLERKFDKEGDGRMKFDEFKEVWADFCSNEGFHLCPQGFTGQDCTIECKTIKICDPITGCKKTFYCPPDHEMVGGFDGKWQAPTPEEGKKLALDDSGSIWDSIFNWAHTWDSEVSMNKRGEIRANHDDPNGHLMPHNKYQNAEYPDGLTHVRTKGQQRTGITNAVGTHLFADNIVTAAPGFNAGTGRHIRAQQGIDWERNWESSRKSRVGKDGDGNPLIVK